MSSFPLKFSLKPYNCELESLSALSDQESESSSRCGMTEELYELKAQLEIVNEDRDRLKQSVKVLSNERTLHLNRFISSYIKKIPVESHYKETLTKQIENMRKECEENDKILNTLKDVLGNNQFEGVLKENQSKKASPVKVNRVNRSNSKLPVPSRSYQANRSVSPYQKLFLANSNY
jgi:flagellar biosynthesis chaperone FliJ